VKHAEEVRRNTSATPEQVFAVLSDGWLFPSWVVGASRMRAVDAHWPAVGARLHHSFGVWPAVIDDETVVLANEAPHRLVLQPKGWPVGEATVEVRVDAWGAGSMVTMTEDASRGPGLAVPAFIRQPVLAVRNVETLRRLIWLAEGGAAEVSGRSGSVHLRE
jgi:uncharacterized protein YndB with AHSA1/START domain